MKKKYKYLYQTIINPNKSYFIGFFCFLIFLGLILITSSNDAMLEFLNNHRTPFLNTFFISATKIAEEEGIIIVFIIFILFKYSALILSAISISMATIVSNIIKTITDLPRPLEVYNKLGDFAINLIPGVEVHRFMSFPSGHTAAAFAMLFFLLRISSNIYQRLIILFLSVSVAISRVYLFQHFTRDVLAASLIGVILALLIYYLFIHFNWFLELDNKKNGLIKEIKLNKKQTK